MNSLFSKVLSLTILLLGLSQVTAAQDCTLPSPDLNIIETTEHSISVEWEPVDGAVAYQLNLYLTESQELIQQVQTEGNTYTFNDLASDTFYDLTGQSGCDYEIYGPEDDNTRTTRTQGGYVIVVDDLRIDKRPCKFDMYFPVPDDLTVYHEIVDTMPMYDTTGMVNSIILEMAPQTPAVLLGDTIELLVLRDPNSADPNDPDLIVAVYASSQSRVMVDQNLFVWMNEANNPNNWHVIADIDDPLTPGPQLMIGWVEEVELNTYCGFVNEISIPSNPPTGNDDDDSDNPALTSQTDTNKPAATLTTKETTTPLAYPNPVADRLTVELPTGGGTVQVMDINGKVWHQVNTQNQRLEVDMNNWPAGTYILRYDDGKAPHIQRVVKL